MPSVTRASPARLKRGGLGPGPASANRYFWRPVGASGWPSPGRALATRVGLVSQGLTILDSVRRGLPSQYQASPPNGRAIGGLAGPEAQAAAKNEPEAESAR